MNARTGLSRRLAIVLALTIALAAGAFAFGSKMALVRSYGSDVPYMDEWDAEGGVLLIPLAEHRLEASAFFKPHNEHRVVLTRLINLGLTLGNGQWDPLVEMVANAALHSAFCVLLIVFASRFVSGGRFAMVSIGITALFALSYDWENTIEGFQSQFYLLEWTALGMFWLCLPAVPLGKRWFCGLFVGVLALGTMSSGFVAAGATLGAMVFRGYLRKRWSGRDSAAAALLFALCIAGLLLLTHVAGHDKYKAHSPGEWIAGVAKALSWPTLGWPLAFLVLQLPLVLILRRIIAERATEGPGLILITLGAWSWLQIAALAYGRANYSMMMSPRYMDLFANGSAANLIALAWLWRPPARAPGWTLLAAGWVFIFVAGLHRETLRSHVEFLDGFAAAKETERHHLRSFLATGDVDELRNTPPDELPYPDGNFLAYALSHPGIRTYLPMGIRPPLAVTAAAGSNGFVSTVSKDLPMGAARRIWLARSGPARLVSAPLEVGELPLLHLALCGGPGLDASVVRLESPSDTEILPPLRLSEDQWAASDIRIPEGRPVRLVVEIPAGRHWLALVDPVELGRASWWVHWLLRRADVFTAVPATLLALSLIAITLLEIRSGLAAPHSL